MKTNPFGLTKSQKKKFYSQELFDDYVHLKTSLRLVVVLIGLFELGRVFFVESQRKQPTLEGYQRWIAYTTTSVGSFFAFISTFQCMERKFSKRIQFRSIFLLLSGIGLAVGTFSRTIWELDFVLHSHDPDLWLDVFTISVNLGFGIVFSDVIFPNWIMKMLVPVAMFIGVVIAIIQSKSVNSFVLLFRVISIAIYVICLSAIKDQFRWKIFLKRMEDETWKALQTKILEEIPTSIAILDAKEGKIIYTNAEFKKRSLASDPYEFFKGIKKLIKRTGREESLDFGSEIGDMSDCSINIEVSPEHNQPSHSVEDHLNPKESPRLNNKSMFEVLKSFCSNNENKISKEQFFGVYDGIYTGNQGENLSLEVKISCIAQYPKAAIIMINDTTQRDLIVSLQSNNKYKDSLIASISHELRTPLNGSLALLESAIQSEEEQRVIKEKYLVPALRSSRILVYKINDILDYSLIGANTLRLAVKNFSIQRTLKDCYDLMELQAKKKGLKFMFIMHTNTPHSFLTDHTRVKQILLNLLSNAVKYTFEGQICVEAKMRDKSTLDVLVSDTGIGLTPEEIEKIQTKSPLTGEKINKNSTGCGLGLTVSRKLAKFIGPSDGEGIKIESEYGKGSAFSFKIHKKIRPTHRMSSTSLTEIFESSGDMFRVDNIPSSMEEFKNECSPSVQLNNGNKYVLSTNCKEDALARRFSLPHLLRLNRETSLPRMNQVLIVDDDAFNILALESLLEPLNIKADKAFNGKEAIEKILQKKQEVGDSNPNYKLIIMDFNMPIMNGHETTKTLRDMMSKGNIPKIKIVGCTAYNTKVDIDMGMKSGMVEVITKPVTKDILLPVLRRHLDNW